MHQSRDLKEIDQHYKYREEHQHQYGSGIEKHLSEICRCYICLAAQFHQQVKDRITQNERGHYREKIADKEESDNFLGIEFEQQEHLFEEHPKIDNKSADLSSDDA